MTINPTKPIPGSVLTTYNRVGKPYALIMLLDGQICVEASARTALAFERCLKVWTGETLPTLYRSDVRVFLCTKASGLKEVTLSKRSITL